MQAMTIEDVLKATGGTLLSGDIHQTFNDVISDSRKVRANVRRISYDRSFTLWKRKLWEKE